MNNIQFYPNNKVCPHCIWIANSPGIYKKFKRILKQTPFVTIPSEKNFLGVTVFNSNSHFKHTFNCVNGTKDRDSALFHHYSSISSLLYGSTLFIESLHVKFGVKNVRLLINSNYDYKKHGTKEHPHALITVADDEKSSNELFSRLSKTPGKPEVPKHKVADKPYPGDTVVELTKRECSELLRSDSAIEFITEKLSRKLGYAFHPDINNFYLFLNFQCNDAEKPHCGVVSGKISTDLK
jgi:hypothetical protein